MASNGNSYVIFDTLPVLSEGDERTSLADVLSRRDSNLTELELWAICYECCVAIRDLKNSPESFEELCITPETLAFDSTGNVCFLPLEIDPEQLYVPPEYETIGNSLKAHLYSLGMTMFFSSQYNPSPQHRLSLNLNKLLAEMTAESYDDRADFDEVVAQCAVALTEVSSTSICQELASSARRSDSRSISYEESKSANDDNRLDSVLDDLESTAPVPKSANGSPYSTMTESIYSDEANDAVSPELMHVHDVQNFMQVELSRSALKGKSCTNINHEFESDDNDEEILNREDSIYNELATIGDDNSLGRRSDGEGRCGDTTDDEDTAATPTPHRQPDLEITIAHDADSSHESDRQKSTSNVDEGTFSPAPVLMNNLSVTPVYTRAPTPSRERMHSPQDDLKCILSGQQTPTAPISPMMMTRKIRPVLNNETSLRSRTVSEMSEYSDDDVFLSDSKMEMLKTTIPPVNGTSVQEVLDKLGCGLHEDELWSLCKQAITAIEETQTILVICPMNMLITDGGRVVFRHSSTFTDDDSDFSTMYIAPELNENDPVTEKSCVFSLAATLWTAADHNLPDNQEPDLSEQLENLLVDSVCKDHKRRPTLLDILEVCEEVDETLSHPSHILLQALLRDARHANVYGINNAHIQESLTQEVKKTQQDLLDTIRNINPVSLLKPVSERVVAEKKSSTPTPHDMLMEAIQLHNKSALKKAKNSTGQRRGSTAEIAMKNLDFLENLKNSTPSKSTRSDSVDDSEAKRDVNPPDPVITNEKLCKRELKFGEEVKTLADLTSSEASSNSIDTKTNEVKAIKASDNFDDIGFKPVHGGGAHGIAGSAFRVIKPTAKQPTNETASSVVSTVKPSAASESPKVPNLPKAFTSPANHFTPIVLASDEKSTGATSGSEVEIPATKEQPKKSGFQTNASKIESFNEKNRKVKEKLDELKRHLRSRPPPNMVKCLEEDAKERISLPSSTVGVKSGQDSDESSAGAAARPPIGVATNRSKSTDILGRPRSRSSVDLTPTAIVQPRTKANPEKRHSVDSTIGRAVASNISPEHTEVIVAPVRVDYDADGQNSGQSRSGTELSSSSRSQIVNNNSVPSIRSNASSSHSSTNPIHFQMAMLQNTQFMMQQDPNTGLIQLVPVVSSVTTSLQQQLPSFEVTDFQNSASERSSVRQPDLSNSSVASGARGDSCSGANNDERPSSRQRIKSKSRLESVNSARSHSSRPASRTSDTSERSQRAKSLQSRQSSERSSYRNRLPSVTEARIANSLHQVANSKNEAKLDVDLPPPLKRMSFGRQSDNSHYRRSFSDADLTHVTTLESSNCLSHLLVTPKNVSVNKRSSNIALGVSGVQAKYRAISKSTDDLRSEDKRSTLRLSLELDDRFVTKERRQQTRMKAPMASPILGVPPNQSVPSPPLTPSLSKDSGVSGVNMKSALMERFLNSEGMRRGALLTKVIALLREEFAFDGYMENGVEDLAMGEYVLSLNNLKWGTFCNAITEKYCDLYWSEDLLSNLYAVINGLRRNHTAKSMEDLIGKAAFDVNAVNSSTHQAVANVTAAKPENDPRSAFRPITFSDENEINPIGVLKPKPVRNLSDITPSNHNPVMNRKHKNESAAAAIEKENVMPIPEKRIVKEKKNEIVVSESEQTTVSQLTGQKDGSILDVVVTDDDDDEDDFTLNISTPKDIFVMPYTDTEPSNSFDYMPNSPEHPAAPKPRLIKVQSSQAILPTDHSLSQQSRRLNRRGSTSSVVSGKLSVKLPEVPLPVNIEESSRDLVTVMTYYLEKRLGQWSDTAQVLHEELSWKSREAIELKMTEIEQEIMLVTKMRRKSQVFYKKMIENTKAAKGAEQKSTMAKVFDDISTMTKKILNLKEAKRHLEMVYAERWGLNHCLLSSLARWPPTQVMDLQAENSNLLLQFKVVRNRPDAFETQVLQAGTPLGLTAYLFSKESVSEGFVHEFFYSYRYFTTSKKVLTFLLEKFTTASSSLSDSTAVQKNVQHRAIDLLTFWLQGYYNLDFKNNPDVTKQLETFFAKRAGKSNHLVDQLYNVYGRCKHFENHLDLHVKHSEADLDIDDEIFTTNVATDKQQKKNEILKMPAYPKLKPLKQSKNRVVTCIDTHGVAGSPFMAHTLRNRDDFSLTDFTAQTLAEQLTLMEQALFQQTHPVLFLNSKAQGIGVSMTTSANKTSAMTRLNVWSGPQENSLFIDSIQQVDNKIIKMIEFSQSLTHWVSGEILSCSSAKAQLAVLSKLIYTAKICLDLKNYATAVSIVDGLENLIVRQLPIWRQLPSKCATIMEELTRLKFFLKKDNLCLIPNDGKRSVTTIPCILLFLLHVQQLEIGGFTLANGMYRWQKFRSISELIDQIRVFMRVSYKFASSAELQLAVRKRMRDFRDRDLQEIAAQHDTNMQKISSSKWSQSFQKLKSKLQGTKGDN
ncbi:uncharacterized protein LOC141899028 [Tubulanus polymorphus]|uniref:uncharacterized protein LOC141899028 n=1 Tax=Tubulanus polymorphus TaxID=672921 RepID=UPI003DA4AA5B